MKLYTNSGRKPMMCGGDTKRQKRAGGTTDKMGERTISDETRKQMQERENIERMYEQVKDIPSELAKMKKAAEKDMQIRNFLMSKGVIERPSAPTEQSGM
jgi:hypothetical protein